MKALPDSHQTIIPGWKVSLELTGLDFSDERVLTQATRYFSKEAGLARTYVWQILRGMGCPPSDEQQQRIIHACEKMIEARQDPAKPKEVRIEVTKSSPGA